jgi:hypothetical protein
MVYPAFLPLTRTPRLPVVDWTDAPADLNGLVRFAERRNLNYARVPSHFKRSPRSDCKCMWQHYTHTWLAKWQGCWCPFPRCWRRDKYSRLRCGVWRPEAPGCDRLVWFRQFHSGGFHDPGNKDGCTSIQVTHNAWAFSPCFDIGS